MPRKTETKHEAFMRLMTRRLERALVELRLVSQLSTDYYENTPEEAEEVVRILDKSVTNIAQLFDVPYVTSIGEDAHLARKKQILPTVKGGKIDEIDIVKAIEFIKGNKPEEAIRVLKAAMLEEAR